MLENRWIIINHLQIVGFPLQSVIQFKLYNQMQFVYIYQLSHLNYRRVIVGVWVNGHIHFTTRFADDAALPNGMHRFQKRVSMATLEMSSTNIVEGHCWVFSCWTKHNCRWCITAHSSLMTKWWLTWGFQGWGRIGSSPCGDSSVRFLL